MTLTITDKEKLKSIKNQIKTKANSLYCIGDPSKQAQEATELFIDICTAEIRDELRYCLPEFARIYHSLEAAADLDEEFQIRTYMDEDKQLMVWISSNYIVDKEKFDLSLEKLLVAEIEFDSEDEVQKEEAKKTALGLMNIISSISKKYGLTDLDEMWI